MALDMSDGDWIPLWRKIRKTWIWKDPESLRAWIDILMMANHHDDLFDFRSRLHPIKRGQVAATILSLSERNGWSRDRVRHFLEKLKKAGSIKISYRTFDVANDTWEESKTDRGFILLTIVNYPVRRVDLVGPTVPFRQSSTLGDIGESTAGRQLSHSKPSADRQLSDTSKKGNKGNNDKKGGDLAAESAPPAAPLTPPDSPSAGTAPEESGKPCQAATVQADEPRTGKPEDIAASYRLVDPSVPRSNCLDIHIIPAIKRGVDPIALHDAVIKHRDRMKLWTICDLLTEAPKSVAPPEKPAILREPRDAAQARKDLALMEVDTKLSEIPPEEVAVKRKELEEEADAKKITVFGREMFINTGLRKWAAAKFGIAGV